jgi:flagellar protein FliO/FliZ
MSGLGLQSVLAVFIVLALVGAMAWLVRRGAFGALRHGGRAITVETAVPIGERRSLIIVLVEGRRLLLGVTPTQITMVAELGAQPAFETQLKHASA